STVPSTSSGSSSPSSSNGSSSGSGSSSAPIGAIIGGVVGGLVVIALVAFLFIRSRRASGKTSGAANVQPQGANQDPSKMNPATAPLMEQNYVLQQQQQAVAQNQQLQYQQQQQQQFNPHLSYMPPQQDIYSAQPLTTVPVQQQAQPKIFQPQAQEPYNYTPPTLIPQSQPQPQQPNIFQAQESSPQNHYSQAGYMSPTSAATPQTPGSQPYTPTHSNNTAASPQYIAPPNGDGYAA
ncbi:hypothetical protein BGZ58_009018, partial [Dissophora ornata]